MSVGVQMESNDVAKAAMNEIRGICSAQSTWLAWPNQLAAKVRVRFMVMVWLEGKGKGKVLGRAPNSSVSVIPTCPSQHPFRLAGSQTP